jgi:ribosomal protein S18 acetylase RimI-like enzyme
MIKDELLDMYLKVTGKNKKEIDCNDATILNTSLYNLLNSEYMKEDFFEIVPMYNEQENYLWLKRNAKLIQGKASNNIVMDDEIDCSGINSSGDFENLKETSSPVLLKEDVNKWSLFEKEFSLKAIESIGSNKIKNYLNLPDGSLFDDLHEMLKENPSSRKLGKLIEKYSLDMDMEEDEVFVSLQNIFYKNNKDKIKRFSNARELESVISQKAVKDFEKSLQENMGYVSSLKQKPSEKEIAYKVFKIDSDQDHYDYNKWVSEEKSPLLLTKSPWVNYGQKGLFYLTPVSKENGFSQKYMIVAYNDLEVVGVTQLNDLSSAMRADERDENAYKMPYIGIQQKYRGHGLASKMFEKVLEIVEQDEKFLLRTAPSEMGGKYTQAKFTKMGEKLTKGILVNSEEATLYDSFKEEVKNYGDGISFSQKRSMFKILKEEMMNKLIEDKHFHYSDAAELMSSPKVLIRIRDEVFNAPNQDSKNSQKASVKLRA